VFWGGGFLGLVCLKGRLQLSRQQMSSPGKTSRQPEPGARKNWLRSSCGTAELRVRRPRFLKVWFLKVSFLKKDETLKQPRVNQGQRILPSSCIQMMEVASRRREQMHSSPWVDRLKGFCASFPGKKGRRTQYHADRMGAAGKGKINNKHRFSR